MMSDVISLEAVAAPPVVATMADGVQYAFSRATPRILSELGSWWRAQTGRGQSRDWLTLQQTLDLVRSIEGMEWLAWRCAAELDPAIKSAGPSPFRVATNDYAMLVSLAEILTDYPDPKKSGGSPGNVDPQVEAVETT